MKALSLWNPFAEFMRIGLKTIETRSWPTSYRGALAIHAAKRDVDELGWELVGKFYTRENPLNPMYYGAVVAVVDLSECVRVETFHDGKGGFCLTETELELGDYSNGRFAWMTRHAAPLRKPLPMRGRQGLWNLAPQEIQQINERL